MNGDPQVEIREYVQAQRRCHEVLDMQAAIMTDTDIDPHERDAELDRLDGRLAFHRAAMHRAQGALQHIEIGSTPRPRLVA